MSYGKTQASSRWFRSSAPRPEAAVRLFVLPYAGGSAAAYAKWASQFDSDVDVKVVQLPGRQDRRQEDAFTEMEPLVDALFDAVDGEGDNRPFAVFGHSMGALLGYRLTVAMESEAGPSPVLLAVSGWAAAAHRTSPVAIADLTDSAFIEEARKFGALPPEITENEEMRALALPALRADFSVVNGYSDDRAPVSCPVAAYGGSADPAVESSAMATWADLTTDFLGYSEYPGDHFYFAEHALSLSVDLTRKLRRCVPDMAR